jgi:hypothetical protein
MAPLLTEEIQARAYELWEAAGHRGDSEDHWFQAERELLARHAAGDSAPAPETSSDPGEIADRLRPFYQRFPDEPVPGHHWDLVLELAMSAEDDNLLPVPRLRENLRGPAGS